MLIQDQLPASRIDDNSLSFFKAIGVDCLTINPPPFTASHDCPSGEGLSDYAEVRDFLRGIKSLAERNGLQLSNVAVTGHDDITLARPERDRRIVQFKDVVRAMGEVGVATLGYNFKPIGNFRTAPTVGRGGAHYSTFAWAEWEKEIPSHPEKQIGEEAMWANITSFLEEVVPVAEESGVRLALHPDDPPIPEPMAGAARIVSTIDQYRRIFDIAPSRANGMLFCQGCVTEMGVDVLQAIRDIGSIDKIVYVHFRNVRGSLRSFQEVFLDEGDVDMIEAMRTYRDVGFEGPFMMDHTPGIPGDRASREGHAFATGYIRALLQSVYR